MNPRAKALRAISSVYVVEIIRPIAIAAVLILVGIAGVIVYLASVWSAWWLIFLVIVTVFGGAVITALFLGLALARKIAPTMNAAQYIAAKQYVKNMHDVNDRIATPQIFIIFKVLKDLIKRRWKGGFIQETTTNSVRLKHDLEELVKLFEES